MEDLSYFGILPEALKDDLPDYMQKVVRKKWGNKFLEHSPLEKAKEIPDVKQVIPMGLAREFLNKLFQFDPQTVKVLLSNFYVSLNNMGRMKEFENFFYTCIDMSELKQVIDLHDLWVTDIHNLLSKNLFRLPDTKQTKENLTAGKENPIVITKNKGNINTFIARYCLITDARIENPFVSPIMTNIVSLIPHSVNEFDGTTTQFDIDLFSNNKLVLYVSGKSDDVLRMSLSDFYDSCMNMYDGELRARLLANVFDKNMKVAYVILDTPWIDKEGNSHPFTPLARVILRKMDEGIFCDKAYPQRQFDCFVHILQSAGIIVHTKSNSKYTVDNNDLHGLPPPYIDYAKLDLRHFSESDGPEEIKKKLAFILKEAVKEISYWDKINIVNRALFSLPREKKSDVQIQKICFDAIFHLWRDEPYAEFKELMIGFKNAFGFHSRVEFGGNRNYEYFPYPRIINTELVKHIINKFAEIGSFSPFRILLEMKEGGLEVDLETMAKEYNLPPREVGEIQHTKIRY